VANVAAPVCSTGFFDSPKGTLFVEIHLEKSEKGLLDKNIEGASDIVVIHMLRV
jgi:hypothetical protein